MRMKLDIRKAGIAIVILIGIILSYFNIVKESGKVPEWPMDQSFVSKANLHIYKENGVWQFHYPKLQHSGGITATLTIGLYKLILPTKPNTLNYHAKIFSMLFYFFSSYFLASQYLKTRLGLFIFTVIMLSSGSQFIEPSSELIACSYFFAFLLALARSWNPVLTTLFLVCFGLCKVELVIIACFIIFYWISITRSRKSQGLILISFFLWLGIFITPGLILYGIEIVSGNRAFHVFGWHYSSIFAKHQLVDIPFPPCENYDIIMSKVFQNANSFFDIIAHYPRKYIDYVALSFLHSLIILFITFNGMIIIQLFLWLNCDKKTISGHFEPMILIAFVTSMLPIILISSLHPRYLAKIYLPFVLLNIIYWEYSHINRLKFKEILVSKIVFYLIFATILCNIWIKPFKEISF